LSAINGPDIDDSCSVDMPFNFDATKPVKGLRVGYIPASLKRQGINALHGKAIDALRNRGCDMVEFDLPTWPYDCLMNLLECEAAAAFEELTRTGKDDLLKAQTPDAWPNN